MAKLSGIAFALVAPLLIAGMTEGQAQPCVTNFNSAGVPMVSQITYKTWDLFKKPPAAVLLSLIHI